MNILTIDLDFFWSSSKTAYADKKKELTKDYNRFFQIFKTISFLNIKVGIDHSELLYLLDETDKTEINITNLDAHHDFYITNPKWWILDYGMRGLNVEIGNFFFFLMREEKIKTFDWIIPEYFSLENTRKELENYLGNYYANQIKSHFLANYTFQRSYDLLYVCISPEWIPISDSKWIKEWLKLCNLNNSDTNNLIFQVENRWKLGDDNELINENRFKYPLDSML